MAVIVTVIVATNKSTSNSKAKVAISDPAAAAKTDVPSVIVSDDFHAPISENQGGMPGGSGRIMRFVLLVVLLIIAATLYVWLTHDKPVG